MKKVSIDILNKKVIQKLQEVNVLEKHAKLVANVLVDADARKIHSHGTIRLEHYINRIKAGGINLNSQFSISQGNFPWAYCIDAQGGLGHVASNKAVDIGIKTVQTQGIAIVSVKNTSHCGTLGYYARKAAQQNIISFIALNTDKCVVPYGGKESFFGTNPLAWGFPQENVNNPVIVDMSTSAKSLGDVFTARDEGQNIPSTWAVDKNGIPTENPNEAKALLPMAAHKGYALALVAETLSALLTGSAFGPHVTPMYEKLKQTRNLSAFFLFLTPGIYQNTSSFTKQMTQMVHELHQQSTAEGVANIMVPGEKEQINANKSKKDGVFILDSVGKFLQI